MALSPNSATFREIVSNFEEAGLDPVSEESLAMLSRVNPDLDIEKYKTVYGDYQKIMANPDFAKLYFKDDRVLLTQVRLLLQVSQEQVRPLAVFL